MSNINDIKNKIIKSYEDNEITEAEKFYLLEKLENENKNKA